MSDENSRIDDLIIKGIDKVESKVDRVNTKVEAVETDLKELNSQFRAHEEIFKKHLETDEKMYQEFSRMNSTLKDNTDSLKEHMRRTEILEESVVKINDRLTPIEEERIRKEAVQDFLKSRIKRWSTYLGIAATVIGIAYTVSRLI